MMPADSSDEVLDEVVDEVVDKVADEVVADEVADKVAGGVPRLAGGVAMVEVVEIMVAEEVVATVGTVEEEVVGGMPPLGASHWTQTGCQALEITTSATTGATVEPAVGAISASGNATIVIKTVRATRNVYKIRGILLCAEWQSRKEDIHRGCIIR